MVRRAARHLLLACLLYEENGEAQEPTNDAYKPKTVEFKPYQPKYRKRGTGSVHQVSKVSTLTVTRSPGFTCVTAEPTSSTIPTIS